MRNLVLIFVTALCFMPFTLAQSEPALNLMPMPAVVRTAPGQLTIDQHFAVAVTGEDDGRARRATERFLQNLSKQTGIPISAKLVSADKAKLVIHSAARGEKVQKLGEDESYMLTVTPDKAELNAPNPLGVIRGLQTFLQLVQVTPSAFAAPAVSIEDKPRFPWRGMLLDVCRHWMPVEVVKRNLDAMEAVKMNVLHWHLSEDQGFRVESKKYPKLQEMGSDGLYYTQDQIKDVVQYARDRGIRVVPEFDMPGHSSAWFVGYPELAGGPGPYEIQRTFGIFDDAMDPTRDSTYKFLDKFIGEMTGLFPDQYFHIGGDEVKGTAWNTNAKIIEFKRTHNMQTNQDLQAHFNQRIQKIVAKRHRIMVGWDEIFHPDLPKDVVVQSWRGQKSLAEGARNGYRGILSHGYYLDMLYPAARYYIVDPLQEDAANLSPEERQRIIGGESCMWAELVNPENVDSRIWPSNAVIAERLWSPQEIRDIDSMYRRIDAIDARLDWLGVKQDSNFQPMLQRLAGTGDASAVRVLAQVVEPVKHYDRHHAEKPNQLTPLNRLVDAVHPESEKARHFGDMVDHLLAGQATAQEKATIREWLTLWRDNDVKFQQLAPQSFLLPEDAELSKNLSALGAAGLQALDYLNGGGGAPATWRTEQLALADNARKPQASLLLMVVPSVQKLIEATTPQ